MKLHKQLARAHTAMMSGQTVPAIEDADILSTNQELTLEVQEYETLLSLRVWLRLHAPVNPTTGDREVTITPEIWEAFFK